MSPDPSPRNKPAEYSPLHSPESAPRLFPSPAPAALLWPPAVPHYHDRQNRLHRPNLPPKSAAIPHRVVYCDPAKTAVSPPHESCELAHQIRRHKPPDGPRESARVLRPWAIVPRPRFSDRTNCRSWLNEPEIPPPPVPMRTGQSPAAMQQISCS